MQRNLRSRFALLGATFLCVAIAGCGGGGGGDASPTPPPVVGAPPPPPAPPPLASTAYLVEADKIQLCNIEVDGALSGCADAGVAGFDGMSAMAIAGSHAYISNLTDPPAVIHCSIGATGILSGCTPTGIGSPGLYGLTARGTTLYLGDTSSPRVRKCEIREDGGLEACVSAGVRDTLAEGVEEIRFVDSTAFLLHYVEGRVSRCAVEPDGSLSGCTDAAATGLVNPEGFAISGSHLYVAHRGSGDVMRCIISALGSLTNCEDSGASAVGAPTQIAIRGSTVYIAYAAAQVGVTRCTANSDGLLTDCTSTPGGPSYYSIVLR